MVLMQIGTTTAEDAVRLREAVRELAWQRARARSALNVDEPPAHPFDAETLNAEGHRAALLATLAGLQEIRFAAEQLIEATATAAGEAGASGEAIGAALRVTRSAVRKRWPHVVSSQPGPRSACPATHGREDWFSGPEDGVADRDWRVHAHVRLLRDVSTGGYGWPSTACAGQEMTMVMTGRAGSWVYSGWFTEDGPAALRVASTEATVIELLDYTPPWTDPESSARWLARISNPQAPLASR